MYTSAGPSHYHAPMRGSVRIPVSDQSLNGDYNQSLDDSFFRAFTPGQNQAFPPTSAALPGPSHDTVPSNSTPLSPEARHSGPAIGQSSTWSAASRMINYVHPQYRELGSPWSAQHLGEAFAARVDAPPSMPHTALQPLIWPLDIGDDIVQAPLAQGLESGSSVLAYPPPGETPISALEGIPSDHLVFGAGEYLGMTSPPQPAETVHLQDRQIQQNAPVGPFAVPDMLESSVHYLPPDAANAFSSSPDMLYLPEWVSGTTETTAGGYSADAGNVLFGGAASSDPVEDFSPAFHAIVDPSELGSLDNLANLDDVGSVINSALGIIPSGLPNDANTYEVMTKAEEVPSSNWAGLLNQHPSEPLIPGRLFDESGEISLGDFAGAGTGAGTGTGTDSSLSGLVLTPEHPRAEDDGVLPGQPLNAFPPLPPLHPPPPPPPPPPQSVASELTEGGRHRQPGRRNMSRDEELVELRRRGVPYRDIKQKYGFHEAESTLRGRIRSLTKAKEQRVRKPVWRLDDISLLCTCVIEYAIEHQLPADVIGLRDRPVLVSEHSVNKVSWKRVAETMAQKGSYHYGNATAKKKYKEVRNEQLAKARRLSGPGTRGGKDGC